MHFHNGLLILVFLCDVSGRVDLIDHDPACAGGKIFAFWSLVVSLLCNIVLNNLPKLLDKVIPR